MGKSKEHFLTFLIVLNYGKFTTVFEPQHQHRSQAEMVLLHTFSCGCVTRKTEVSPCPPTHIEEPWRLLSEHPQLCLAHL